MRVVFFSDVHLKREDEARVPFVTRFIRDVSRGADMVFILGDIFEFYHGYDGYIYPWYRDVADVMKEIARDRPVHYIEGNHEFGMGPFFQSYTGIACCNEMTVPIDGRKTFLSHGDELNSIPLKRILKSSPVCRLMDTLGPSLTWKIAMGFSLFLSKRTKPYNEKVKDRFRDYARRKLNEGYDNVIMAHTHIPDLVEYSQGDKKSTYVNTGALTGTGSYAEYISGKGFSLKTTNSLDTE
jgi:UDP-2,3-diacylglucosamine hydrolase